jgi:hypothetical protein
MTDPRAAALAEQLHKQFGCSITCRGGRLANDGHPSHAEAWSDTADAILAALPPDWCGHDTDGLREALAFIAREYHDLAIGDERVTPLHPAVSWENCPHIGCAKARAALAYPEPAPLVSEDTLTFVVGERDGKKVPVPYFRGKMPRPEPAPLDDNDYLDRVDHGEFAREYERTEP